MRKIIHIDMDAFYASVEQRDFVEYRNIPIAVGGLPEGRGVVAAASYEARKYGVRSAMSAHTALRLCPHITFVKPRFDVYKEVSQEVRAIFKRYTDIIEPLSLDEAYLDVTNDKKKVGSALDIAMEIKKSIKSELQLTASAGVSINKFVAKIASDMDKPDGLTFIGPSKIEIFMEKLAIDKFYGVGKVTAQKMKLLGIHTGKDLKKFSKEELILKFGKSGGFYYDIVRGIDDRPVRPDRAPKTIGAEDTFLKDIGDIAELKKELMALCEKVEHRMKSKNQMGRTVTLKVKYSDFKIITRSFTQQGYIQNAKEIYSTAAYLLDQIGLLEKEVRLLGVSVSNFYSQEPSLQLSLF